MAVFPSSHVSDRLVFDRNEVTGAIGDSITVLPLVVALALLTDISLPHVLIAFGVFQIVWGVAYGMPISVEPMKALAALAIAGALTYAELALAGIVLGVVLLAIGISGTLAKVRAIIGDPVIRGVQLGVALILVEMSYRLVIDDLWFGGMGLVLVLLVILVGWRNASAIIVLGVGMLIALGTAGAPTLQFPGVPPIPSSTEIGIGRTLDGVIAQLAMSIGNAALATSLLVSDLYDRDVSPDTLSSSMGITNLIAIPAGGIPMCHGCDGVAGKHEFGARTGGANVIIGIGYVGAAFVLTIAVLQEFPLALLGILLALVAVSLLRHVPQSSNLPLSIGIGVLGVLINLGVAFLLGVIAYLLFKRYD